MDFELIDKAKYQVFVFNSRSHIPFFFASHPWFVINRYGSVSRWEVLFQKSENENSFGHLHKNFLPPFQGLGVLPFFGKLFWKGKMLGQIEESVAERIAEFIENSPAKYPYCRKYSLTGPNSNTYLKWVLDNFPEFKLKLPGNSFGLNYKRK